MDRGAGAKRDLREPTRIRQGLDGAGARIEQRALVDVGADPPRRLRAAEHLDRRPARAPLLRALLDLAEPGPPDRTMQRAVAHELAIDPVLVDKRVDFRRTAAE